MLCFIRCWGTSSCSLADLLSTAAHAINIDAELRNRTVQRVQRGKLDKDVFADAEKEVLKLIQMNDIPRLCKTSGAYPCSSDQQA